MSYRTLTDMNGTISKLFHGEKWQVRHRPKALLVTGIEPNFQVPGYLADDIHLASESSARSLRSCSGESALSLVFTVVLLQLDHVSGTAYLPVCETTKSAAQNSENN